MSVAGSDSGALTQPVPFQTDCAFTHESGDTMTKDEYEHIPAVDRKRFMDKANRTSE